MLPAVSQIRIFSMKNDHEKGFSSICFSSLPFLSSSPFTAYLCQLLCFHFLCASLHLFFVYLHFFFYIYFHPCLFPRECTLRAGVCIRYPPLPSSVYFPHARSHMGFNYEQMPGKCKARAHACTAEPCPTSSCECCYRL